MNRFILLRLIRSAREWIECVSRFGVCVFTAMITEIFSGSTSNVNELHSICHALLNMCTEHFEFIWRKSTRNREFQNMKWMMIFAIFNYFSSLLAFRVVIIYFTTPKPSNICNSQIFRLFFFSFSLNRCERKISNQIKFISFVCETYHLFDEIILEIWEERNWTIMKENERESSRRSHIWFTLSNWTFGGCSTDIELETRLSRY